MNTPALPLTCWIVTEGLAGTENQCIGVAEALGLIPEIKRISLRAPWSWLSPYLGFECAWTFTPALVGPWPDLVIASGRKSIAAARYIKKQSKGKSFVVQIQDPRVSTKQFDLVAVPKHDPTRGDNVIVTTAAPNKITPEKLAAGRDAFPQFERLPSPRVAVLIGGNSKSHSLSSARATELIAQLNNIEGGLMITASRRTGPENEKLLREGLSGPNIFFWDGTGPNPYMGMLGWADFILVTADSTSMLSEAASTGKPTYVIPMDGGSPRLDAMQRNLTQSGQIRPFTGHLEPWAVTPLMDATNIATEIRRRMAL